MKSNNLYYVESIQSDGRKKEYFHLNSLACTGAFLLPCG